jgi:hypothetical protein
MSPIQFPGTLDGASRKKDKSISVRVVSNLEMSTEDFSEIDRRLGHEGWFTWSSNALQAKDILAAPAPVKTKTMSPSQELRWELKLLHEAEGSDMEFDEYYRMRMRRITDQVKERRQEKST